MKKDVNKQTIIELCMSPDLGGLELYMAEAAKFLSSCFNVISIINEKSKLEEYLVDENYLKVHSKSKFSIYLSAKKIAKIIDNNCVELVHIHWTKDLPLAVLAKLISKRKPKIVQSRHMTMTRFKDDLYHRFLYRQVDMMLSVTKQVQEQIERFIPNDIRPKVFSLYPGAKVNKFLSENEKISLKKRLGFNSQGFNIGMVGRINRDKGQYLLIEAIELLKERSLNVNAYFVGNAMQDSYLESLQVNVRNKELESNVAFLGFMDAPSDFYQLCDVIVLASKRETFGLVLVEGMMHKCAVVGADTGGVIEIIDDKETGLLFKSQDSEDLANKLELLMRDTLLLDNIRAKGQKKSLRLFNSQKQFQALAEIFQNELVC